MDLNKQQHKGHFKLSMPVPAVHATIWLMIILIPVILFRNVKFDTGLPRGFFIITTIIHIGLFYLNVYLLFPRLLNRRFWPIYILFLVGIIPALYHLKLFMVNLADPQFVLTDTNKPIILFPPVPFLIASFIFIFIRSRLTLERKEKEKRAEAMASELKFLRSQISPHFLFNVMTNLVSLARTKSDLLEPTLIRFSEMLRYILYETNQEKFPVSKEIEYLRNYVELQKLRFGDDMDLRIDIQNGENDCNIEPMLLIPFVENAFKHGIGLATNPFIHIKLFANQKPLLFSITNNYVNANSSKDKSSGIGLANVRNRLLLLYGDRQRLNIKDENGIYQVELILDLKC
ncbi:sensor histidine kinase [Flavitalea sp.]|nr:histidine kinase [Flavitalea sp.]